MYVVMRGRVYLVMQSMYVEHAPPHVRGAALTNHQPLQTDLAEVRLRGVFGVAGRYIGTFVSKESCCGFN